ncbi:acyl carrier protein [Streptomyces sp. NPDC091268]|uniref:acyl carrier protein n=1 Tax=Streptomyces sp. NPDC091268 TaxID=3365979 RepID=UPI003827A6A7
MPATPPATSQGTAAQMIEILADLTEVEEQEIDTATTLADLNMDSLMRAELETVLAQEFGRSIAAEVTAKGPEVLAMTVGQFIAWLETRLAVPVNEAAS